MYWFLSFSSLPVIEVVSPFAGAAEEGVRKEVTVTHPVKKRFIREQRGRIVTPVALGYSEGGKTKETPRGYRCTTLTLLTFSVNGKAMMSRRFSDSPGAKVIPAFALSSLPVKIDPDFVAAVAIG
jgi:hypothetical protein